MVQSMNVSKFLDRLLLASLVFCLVLFGYSQFYPGSEVNLAKKAAATCHAKGGAMLDGQCVKVILVDDN